VGKLSQIQEQSNLSKKSQSLQENGIKQYSAKQVCGANADDSPMESVDEGSIHDLRKPRQSNDNI
jgi:hypothetical protein